jgi:molybdate transport system permease protein
LTDWTPVYISLKVAFFATIICIMGGVPLAWLLAKRNFPGKNLLSSLITLPMVLPPTVLGYYLLVLVGKQSFIGRFLNDTLGINLVFTWQGAVLAASLVAIPLLVRSVQAGFEGVDGELEDVARTMGKNEKEVFFSVTLPLSWKAFVTGVVLVFARSLGEFGATLMIAGNIPGKTQTLSIAIYDAVQGANYQQANFLVILISLLTISMVMLVNTFSGSKGR